MKKQYMQPMVAIIEIQDKEDLCDGLTGFSVNNESDGSLVDTHNTDTDPDPEEWGTAGAKHFNAWSTWD